MFFLDHIWLIPLLPAFGAAIMFFFGRKLSKQAVDAVCVGVVVLAFLFGCGAVSQYTRWSHDYPGRPFEKILYTWLGSDTGHLNFLKHDGTPAQFQADDGFLLDPLSSIWLLFVTGVMNLVWVAIITAFVLLEKAASRGQLVSRMAGIALIGWATWLVLGVLH